MADQYLENFSYIFIPFSIEKPEDFQAFYKSISEENCWNQIDDEIRYLHRFVTERLVFNSNGNSNLYHFQLNKEFAEKCGLYLDTQWYSTDPKCYHGQSNVNFEFMISDVQLFFFSTSICVLAFELRFKENDPKKIASAQYYLRKITTEKIHQIGIGDDFSSESFTDISKKLLFSQLDRFSLDFFFYASPKNERANFLTYIDVPKKESYDEDLFFLKWCYHDGFEYDDSSCEEDSKNYIASSNICWGITGSAAVCLVNRSEHKKDFIENTFQKNFRNQYLMTYILLLHQKYMMYLFLTKMSIGINGNLKELQKYKKRLYEFENYYMFSNITEVPQYQRFYDKVKSAFSLDQMFGDVREPLGQLSEIEQQSAEKKQREYDYRINTALTTLSLLTVVSALTDASGVTSNLSWLIPSPISKIIQIVAVIAVLILTIVMFCRLLSLKNKH